MRILWVCNIMLPEIARKLGKEYSVREGWLSGIFERVLTEYGEGGPELGICFPVDAEMRHFSRVISFGAVKDGREAVVSCFGFHENMQKPEKYDASLEGRFREILTEFKPDLIHIFGTEFPHTLAMVRAAGHPERLLIGIQGLCFACAGVYMADLPERVRKMATFRDIVKRDSIRQQQKKFYQRGVNEKEAIRGAAHVTGRTRFDREETGKLNPNVKYHPMNETMRGCFYQGSWKYSECSKHQLFVSQADYPLKGFHYLLEAMPILLEKYPDTVIHVAGNNIVGCRTWKDRLKISAYGSYLRSLIKRNGLEDKVKMLGRLNAEQMKEQYLKCHTFICPSALENSPNSVGEAMLLGVPTVAANVGGIPAMLTDGVDGLLYEAGNPQALAEAVITIWDRLEQAVRFSESAAEHAAIIHCPEQNYIRLMEIYSEICHEASADRKSGKPQPFI